MNKYLEIRDQIMQFIRDEEFSSENNILDLFTVDDCIEIAVTFGGINERLETSINELFGKYWNEDESDK